MSGGSSSGSKRRPTTGRGSISRDSWPATKESGKELLTKNLVAAIKDIARKAGSAFSGDALVADVLDTLAFDLAEVERA